MSNINSVIAGYCEGKIIEKCWGSVWIKEGLFGGKAIDINKNTVETYDVINENYKKSASSAIGRGLVGSFLLGPVGLLAGLSAKNKGTHTLQLNFKNGKKSLISVDDDFYSAIIKILF